MRPDVVAELRTQAEAILARRSADDEDASTTLGDLLIAPVPALAAELLGHAARVAEAAGRWSQAASAWERGVKAWIAAGRTEDATAGVEKAIHAAGRIDATDLRLTVLSNLAASMRELGLAHEGADLLRQVIEERRTAAAPDDAVAVGALAAGLVNLATTLIDQGLVAEGLAILGEAETYVVPLAEPIRLATIKINVAFARSSTGDLRAARAAYREAGELYRLGGAAPGDIGYALRGEASTLAQVGRFAEAEELYLEAGEMYAEAGMTLEMARTSIGHVMVRASLDQLIYAAELDALERQLADLPLNERGQLGRNLGNIANRQSDHDRAERLYLQARGAFEHLDRPADVASVDMSRAMSIRRAGEPEKARRLLLKARDMVEPLLRWRQLGHIDHNLSLVLSELAGSAAPAVARELQAEAAARSANAVAALDRFRHDLPTAHDRVALEQTVYPGLFPVAIRCALDAGQVTTAAALIERARVQPVLPDLRDGMAFIEPRPIATRLGDPPIGGSGQVVHLADEAERLAGLGAQWIGWWTDADHLMTSITDKARVRVDLDDSSALNDSLALLAASLPVPTALDEAICDGDEQAISLLALWRAANGPLLGDRRLSEQLAVAVPSRHRREALADEAVATIATMHDSDLLWPLSRLLFGDELLAELSRSTSRRSLVLAPPPLLGRVPWAGLPLADPATGPVRRLIEAADVRISLPASLSASLRAQDTASGRVLLVADPTRDLAAASRMRVADVERLGKGYDLATKDAFTAALHGAAMLVLVAHVSPGDLFDPAASAIRLSSDDGCGEVHLTVAEMANLRVPETCVVLGCDGAGAATGNEWTGVATGLAWAGAGRIVTTIWPVVDDRVTTASDEALIDRIRRDGPYEGLWAWQRLHAAAQREGYSRESAIYRWAGTIAIGLP